MESALAERYDTNGIGFAYRNVILPQ